MKYFFVVCLLAVTNHFKASAQDTLRTNPILYAETYVGFGAAGQNGIMGGIALNFQFRKNLLTMRYTGITDFDVNIASIFIPVPVFENKSTLNEFALLYGLRKITNGHSLSFSAGLSQNKHIIYYRDENSQRYQVSRTYVGMPFEFNIKWFKSDKDRFRIYGLIPVGKPTAFGGSIGFKLSGNISKRSYAALSLVYGLGYHKRY